MIFMKIIASSPEGLEKVLAQEINNYGGNNVVISKRCVSFRCNEDTFYRLHFFSKIAFRFYREISSFECFDKKSHNRIEKKHIFLESKYDFLQNY